MLKDIWFFFSLLEASKSELKKVGGRIEKSQI